MLGKLLLPLLIVAIAWAVLRWRLAGTKGGQPRDQSSLPLVPPGLLRVTGYGLLALMIIGSALYLFQDWERRRAIIEVQVVNPSTGAVQRFEARRGDIDGRSFRTLDGRSVRIAEMERLILID